MIRGVGKSNGYKFAASEGDGEALGLGLSLLDGDVLALSEADGLTENDSEALGEVEALSDADGLTESEIDADGLTDRL